MTHREKHSVSHQIDFPRIIKEYSKIRYITLNGSYHAYPQMLWEKDFSGLTC